MSEGASGGELLPVLIVGGGFAGVAAAWTVSRAGVRAELVQHRSGASALYSGAVDGPPPSAEQSEIARALGLVVNVSPRAVAAREGAVRSVRGRDGALLDLESLAGARIAIADVGRDDWDARLLAPSLSASAWARRTGTRFLPVAVAALRDGPERRIAPYDLASRLDDPARVDHLAAALSAAGPRPDAWLLGPWLGIASDVGERLSASVGCPVGETSSQPGGAAGARFELRRTELLAGLRISVRQAEVESIQASGTAFCVSLRGGARLMTRAVVLAPGGVLAGGIQLVSDPGAQHTWFRLSLEAPTQLSLDGEVLDVGSSLSGVSFQRAGLDALERVGIHTDAGGRAGKLAIFACGDVLAGRPRTVLAALGSGIEAGLRAVASL